MTPLLRGTIYGLLFAALLYGTLALTWVAVAKPADAAGTLTVRHAASAHQLSAAQVRIAKRGVPRACRRYAAQVNVSFSKYLRKLHHRIIGVKELRIALWVMWYESNGRVRCQTGSHIGLFQETVVDFGNRPRWTALSQIATAAMLHARRGWQPWSCTVGLARQAAARTSYAP